MNQNIREFLSRHNFDTGVADNLHEKILSDMQNGLNAGCATIREINEGETAIVIDAGGTNFRSCIVTKNKTGISISDFEKTSMPGIDRELSKEEFFSAIALNIERLKDASDRIAFCFSYAMEITEDGDGRILKFSKEIKAHDAEGSLLAKELKAELARRGWKRIQKVSVLNDTAALLLSGIVATQGQKMHSHVAFILGTGMNSAYIHDGHIIVTECGMFNGIEQSDFDKIVDSRSSCPGQSMLEKMCSGAYLGEIVHAMTDAACTEDLSKDESFACNGSAHLTAADLDPILNGENSILKELARCVVMRSAKLSAEAVYAAIIASDKNKNSGKVFIACNGSTFWKTPLLRNTFEARLKELLSDDFEIVQVADDITAGTFASAFI